MITLTDEERAELSALAHVNDIMKGPSFLLRGHWRWSGYGRFVRNGLVLWGDPPDGFDRRQFAGTTITDKGRELIA